MAAKKEKKNKPLIFTIGHSTRTLDEFNELLSAYGVKQVIDVRTVPKSRHNPQFNEDALRADLSHEKIAYARDEGLGGLRHLRKDSKDSVSGAWRNASFRGYADYMQTDDFDSALKKLEKQALRKRTAIMCAEAVPWRCHRSLIADALGERGWDVCHIFSKTSSHLHARTPFAKVRKGKIVYPSERKTSP